MICIPIGYSVNTTVLHEPLAFRRWFDLHYRQWLYMHDMGGYSGPSLGYVVFLPLLSLHPALMIMHANRSTESTKIEMCSSFSKEYHGIYHPKMKKYISMNLLTFCIVSSCKNKYCYIVPYSISLI